MSKPVIIIFDVTAESAPLYHYYQGQILPQPAYVTLDLNTGKVDADVSGEIGNGMPAPVWHGIIRRYPINATLSSDQVAAALDDIRGLLQRVLDGGEVEWDGSNWVGRLNEDAEAAEDQINPCGAPVGAGTEGLVIPGLTDWIAAGDKISWMPGADDNVAKFIRDFDLDGYITGEDVGDVLAAMWAEELYNAEAIPQNVAQYLIEDGRCADSAWTEELAAYARGEQPE